MNKTQEFIKPPNIFYEKKIDLMSLTLRIKVCVFVVVIGWHTDTGNAKGRPPSMAGCSVKLTGWWLQILICHFAPLRRCVCPRHTLLDPRWWVAAWHVFWLFVCLFKGLVELNSIRPRGFCLPPYICANRWVQFDSRRTQYSPLLPLLTRQKDEQPTRTTPPSPTFLNWSQKNLDDDVSN